MQRQRTGAAPSPYTRPPEFRNGPNTVSGSTVSNTELSEFFRAHRVPGSELSEFLSAYYLWAKGNSPSLPKGTHRVCPVSSLFRNSTLETVFRPFPKNAPKFFQKKHLVPGLKARLRQGTFEKARSFHGWRMGVRNCPKKPFVLKTLSRRKS